MNEQAKVRIKTNLAVQLLAWQWLNNQESGIEYAPPSVGQAIWEYQNVPMFTRVVDSMSHYILGEIEAENARLRRLLKELHTGEETHQEKSEDVEPPPVIVEGGDAAKQAADDLFWINFHKKQQSEKAEPQ